LAYFSKKYFPFWRILEMKEFNLTILTTTDLHGYIFPVDYTTKRPLEYGLAKISTMIKEIRSERPNVLYLDDGDSIQGSPLEYYHGVVDNTDEDPTIKALNYLKCDAMTIGNHEFNFGRKVLEKAIMEANFPVTAANIVDKRTGKPKFGDGYKIFNFQDGPKVAYLCLTTKYIPFWEEQEYINDLEFLDPIEVGKIYVDKLKNFADAIIVGYHGGLERDPESGDLISEQTGENQGYEMATTLDGVSAFIFGHQHRSFSLKIKGVPVIMASSWGKALGRIEMTFRYEKSWDVGSTSVELLGTNGVQPDRMMLKTERPYQMTVTKWLGEPVGEALEDFYISDVMYGRTHETALVNLINDVQLRYSGAELSATSIFSSEVHGWKKGIITRRDVMGTYIFSNMLKVFEFTGYEIKEIMEHSAKYFTIEDGKITSSGDLAGYKYLIFRGVSYVIDLNGESGHRIVNLEKDGKPFDLDRKYTLAVNSYQAGGSGGYTMFIGKKPVKEINVEIAELIIGYIKEQSTIRPAQSNNGWSIMY
jgi:2',3'-cyclic-nucleotide 2'-phosphodiesterase/3'-nucleotidase